MADTVRERILQELQSRFEAIVPDVSNGYHNKYELVTRNPIPESAYNSLCTGGAIIGIYDVSERKERLEPMIASFLTVIIEFYLKVEDDANRNQELNKVLGDVQRIVSSDIQMNGLAANTTEEDNQLDIDGINAKIVSGFVKYTINYRHELRDPRVRM